VQRLSWALEDMIDSSEGLAAALIVGDRAEIDALAERILTQYRVVRLRLDQTEEVAFAAEISEIDSLTAGADQRIRQITIASVAVGLATLLVVVVAGRGHRREQELDHTLRMEKRQLQAIVDCLPVSLVWKAEDGRVIGANTECRRVIEVLGIDQVEGSRFTDITEPEDVAAEMVAMAALALKTQASSDFLADWNTYNLTFVAEAIVLGAFGLAWSVKGRFGPFRNSKLGRLVKDQYD